MKWQFPPILESQRIFWTKSHRTQLERDQSLKRQLTFLLPSPNDLGTLWWAFSSPTEWTRGKQELWNQNKNSGTKQELWNQNKNSGTKTSAPINWHRGGVANHLPWNDIRAWHCAGMIKDNHPLQTRWNLNITGDRKHAGTDNIGMQQSSLSPPKAKDRLSDMEGHAVAPVSNPIRESHAVTPVSNPIRESHAVGNTSTSDPNFFDSCHHPHPIRQTNSIQPWHHIYISGCLSEIFWYVAHHGKMVLVLQWIASSKR